MRIAIWASTVHIAIDDFTPPAFELGEGEHGICVSVVCDEVVIQVLSTVFTVVVVDHCEFLYRKSVIIALMVIEDFHWVNILIVIFGWADWTFIKALKDFTEETFPLVEVDQAVLVSVVFVKQILAGLFSVLELRAVVEDVELGGTKCVISALVQFEGLIWVFNIECILFAIVASVATVIFLPFLCISASNLTLVSTFRQDFL